MKQSRVHLVGGRGIEAVVAIDHTRGNQAMLRWLLYDGQGNLVQVMFPHPLPLSRSFGRGVSRRRRGEGYCANLGHPEDETGLVYMRARYYEPATGRFLSEDPARDGVNWYLYAGGNPVNRMDIDGKDSITLDIAALAALLLPYHEKLLNIYAQQIAGMNWDVTIARAAMRGYFGELRWSEELWALRTLRNYNRAVLEHVVSSYLMHALLVMITLAIIDDMFDTSRGSNGTLWWGK